MAELEPLATGEMPDWVPLKWPVWHVDDTDACGNVAFWLLYPVLPGEVVTADMVQHVDGSPAAYGERGRCGYCGRFLGLALFDPVKGKYFCRTSPAEARA